MRSLVASVIDMYAGTLPSAFAGTLPRELEPGDRVGAFVIDMPVGEGGMGVVYRAHHHVTAQLAAVKVLHASLHASSDAVPRFEREARTLARLRHANVVECIEVGQLEDGRPYLVMEWLEGPTLATYLRGEGALALADAMPIIEGLCAGLAAAHRAGIVHRDIKPGNVILSATVKLVDFGVAKLADDGVRLTTTGVAVGTPAYMAPEQVHGLAATPATDIYGLGILLYVMLCGRHPFPATTLADMEQMHVHHHPARPGSVRAELACVDDVLLRCLEKRPEHRYASAGEVLADLRAAKASMTRARLRTETVVALGMRWGVAAARREALRAACAEHGLMVALETPEYLLAITPLPEAAPAAETVRRRMADLAPRLAPAVDLHAAPVTLLTIDGVTQAVGGELLELEEWPAMGGNH